MSKVKEAIKSAMESRIPELAYLASVVLAKRPKKSDCPHPRNDRGGLICASGVNRVLTSLTSGYTEKESEKYGGFSATGFAASVGAHLGVQKHEKRAFYALCLLLGIDEKSDSIHDTIIGNADKWTRNNGRAMENPKYAPDFRLYGHIPDPLMSWIEDSWNRVQNAILEHNARVHEESVK